METSELAGAPVTREMPGGVVNFIVPSTVRLSALTIYFPS